MEYIDGGVCAAKGFKAAGGHCGLKGSGKPDLALIMSEVPARAAAVYTKNVVQAAPIHVTKRHLQTGLAQAVIVNSGNANACAPQGEENALAMCRYTAQALAIPVEAVAVASTGVIGKSMTPLMDRVRTGTQDLAAKLSAEGSDGAARAIMTTDTVKKEAAVSIALSGKPVHIGAITKGSGMIHPNMGTMLCFITTDAAISADALKSALNAAVKASFNRISVDGDTSTNDMCLILANGLAENPELTEADTDFKDFTDALTGLCVKLARAMAADGEGATHLITCTVTGAESIATAESIAKAVIASSLVKAAIFGGDANWGRVLCAMGYSGVVFDPERVAVAFCSEKGEITVCEKGRGLTFDEALAAAVLSAHEVVIAVDMGCGEAECTCWGCDLTYAYVKINGDYRS